MTENSDFFDPYAEAELTLGRRAPFSQLGDWVNLSGIASAAKDAYWVMFMHAFNEGDIVQSPREVLALLSGAKQSRTVDPYIRQLEAIGASSVARHRPDKELKARNRYTVHQTPPTAYDGPRSIADLYHWRNEAPEGLERYYADRRQWLKDIEAAYQARLKEEQRSGARSARAPMSPSGRRQWLKDCLAMWREQRDGAAPMPPRSAPQRTCENTGQSNGQNGNSAGQPVVRSSALRSAPQRTSQPPVETAEGAGRPVVRHSAHKEDEVFFSLSETQKGREREEASSDKQAVAAGIESVLAAYADTVGRPVINGTRRKLIEQASELIAAGMPVWWLADRARELAERGWTDLTKHCERSTVPTQRKDPSGAVTWCKECDGPNTRMLYSADYSSLEPCPTCNPVALAAARRATGDRP